MSRKKKEMISSPVLMLEEIEQTNALSIPRGTKRRALTAEKKLSIFLEACRCPGRVGEILRREGLYRAELARIRAVVEEAALSALRQVRPGRKPKASIPVDLHEALLREKETMEKVLVALTVENQALKKAWRGGSGGR